MTGDDADADLVVPAGRALNRARLYDAASSIVALSDLFKPEDCEAVALKLEEDASALPEPGMRKAAKMMAGAIRVAAGIAQPRRKRE